MISARMLTVRFPDGFEALKDVTVDFPENRVTAVLGPNGAGKSTLFRCMLGLLKPAAGSVLLDGQDTASLSAGALAARIAYVPQHCTADPDSTVLDYVLLGTMRFLSPFKVPGSKEKQAALDALQQLRLIDRKDFPFHSLSGGECAMAGIARALAQRSEILLMDEPDASLDYGNRIRLMETVRGLTDHTVIFSTHDPQTAMDYADDILAIRDGKIAAFGSAGDLPDTALLQSLYQVPVTVEDVRGRRVVMREDPGKSQHAP